MSFLTFYKKILELKSVKVAEREIQNNHYPWRRWSPTGLSASGGQARDTTSRPPRLSESDGGQARA